MDKIDEQYFETINIQTIRYSAFASANTLEILIENETYAEERRRKIQQILIIIVCCIVFNAINYMHSIFIVLNAIILITIATQTYMLANLIKCGEHNKNFASLLSGEYFHCLIHSVCRYREIVHNKWSKFTVYNTVFFWHKTYLLTHRVYT